MNSAARVLCRPLQSVRLHHPNNPVESTRPPRRADEDDLGHPSIPLWYTGMRTARRWRVLWLVARGSPPRVHACTLPFLCICDGDIGGLHKFGKNATDHAGGPGAECRNSLDNFVRLRHM